MKQARWLLLFSIMCALLIGAGLAGCASKSSEPAPEEPQSSSVVPIEQEISDRVPEKLTPPELEKPFYVLIMGGDTRINTIEGEEKEPPYSLGRSDTIMLTRIDPVNYQITLVSVARDTHMPTEENVKGKINDYLVKGPEESVKAIAELTGVTADYYFATDFSRFAKLIDAVGGVDVNSPISMGFKDILRDGWIQFEPGEQHIDGPAALVFARCRKQYASDIEACRQVQDRQVVESIIKAACASSADNASMYVKAMMANTETNMSEDLLTALVEHFMAYEGNPTIYSGSGPYVGAVNEEIEVWLVEKDTETWKHVMQVVDEGGDPLSVIPLPDIQQG